MPLRTSIALNRTAVVMMEIKKKQALSRTYGMSPFSNMLSFVYATNKYVLPISQTLVRQIKIKMTARNLCKRNKVLWEVREMKKIKNQNQYDDTRKKMNIK